MSLRTVARLAGFAWVLLIGCGTPTRPPATPPATPPARPPNIVLILVDDLGWMDLAVQGNPLVETPNIDRLAAEGMRFTDAYAAAPVCSPTRAAIITGQSPARLGITNHITGDQAQFEPPGATLRAADMLNHLDVGYETIAERLKEAGYATGFFGKWHLSGTADEMETTEPSRRPEHQGFDVNVGGTAFGGPPSFFDPYRNPTIEDRKAGEFLDDRLADETISFVRANAASPFFVALWPYLVHWPMDAPADLVAKWTARPGFTDHGDGLEAAQRYAAQIEALDRAIGRVVAAIDSLGLAGETLIVFTSDNGPYGGVADALPLRAAKGHLYEGGIRVPLVVRWPGRVPAGTVSGVPTVSMDFFPTFLDAAGLAPAPSVPLDGTSLMPVLSGSGDLGREAIFFHYPNYAFHGENRLAGAVREGDYKLIEFYDDGSVELYDLAHDPGETRNLAPEQSARASAMRSRLDDWLAASGARMPTPK